MMPAEFAKKNHDSLTDKQFIAALVTREVL